MNTETKDPSGVNATEGRPLHPKSKFQTISPEPMSRQHACASPAIPSTMEVCFGEIAQDFTESCSSCVQRSSPECAARAWNRAQYRRGPLRGAPCGLIVATAMTGNGIKNGATSLAKSCDTSAFAMARFSYRQSANRDDGSLASDTTAEGPWPLTTTMPTKHLNQ